MNTYCLLFVFGYMYVNISCLGPKLLEYFAYYVRHLLLVIHVSVVAFVAWVGDFLMISILCWKRQTRIDFVQFRLRLFVIKYICTLDID